VRSGRHLLAIAALLHAAALSAGCGLFEPRDPEAPGQSSLDFRPPLDPSIVITNLQSAIDQKSSANYASCFSNPATGGRRFVFLPSAEAAAQYGPAFTDWANAEELAYFENLISRSAPNADAQLLLVMRSSVVTGDSVVYSFDYTFRFEHNDPGIAQTARGNLQFTIAPDAANRWSIHRWADFKTGEDISWSVIKGRFSN
jgi:hypothetical protein